jgi:hypothetical protein
VGSGEFMMRIYIDCYEFYPFYSISKSDGDGVEIRDLARRTKFTHVSKKVSRLSFGCILIIIDRGGLK